MHVPFTHFDISLEVSRVLVQLVDSYNLPVICLHNTPAQYVKLPTYSGPSKDVEGKNYFLFTYKSELCSYYYDISADLRPQGPKRQMKRLLKKEVSLDTYTWQKKYGHLTSSVMMAQVDERLKRRFSVSASMEEISKIAETKTGASQANLGPEQAALAQSQHFDQLEALWNKRSPPRRRHNAVSEGPPLSTLLSLFEGGPGRILAAVGFSVCTPLVLVVDALTILVSFRLFFSFHFRFVTVCLYTNVQHAICNVQHAMCNLQHLQSEPI